MRTALHVVLLSLCSATASAAPLDDTLAAIERESGLRLVFDRASLPPGSWFEVLAPLEPEKRLGVARVVLAEARRYPRRFLGDMGLRVVGVFAGAATKNDDGFHPWVAALGGYRYYGMWNRTNAIVAAAYSHAQLRLTFNHEVFHHVDATRLGVTSYERFRGDDARYEAALGLRDLYPAAAIAPQDLAALKKMATGEALEGAVSRYASKEPSEDEAETARWLMSHLPDALVQVATQPRLAGSQRLLHVLGRLREATANGPDVSWFVGVALGREVTRSPPFEAAAAKAAAELDARLRPQGQFVIHGAEDKDGVNWTLRREVAALGHDVSRLGRQAKAGDDAALTRTLLGAVALVARYFAFIEARYTVTEGTRVVFRSAVGAIREALPPSRAALETALGRVSLSDLAGALTDDVVASPHPTASFVAAAASRGAALNPFLANVDTAVASPATAAALRAVQPATVRLSRGGAMTGSGVNLAPGGLVLTAGHVADGIGHRLAATFPDGRVLGATCTSLDKRLDLALLTLSGDADLPFATLAPAAPAVGDAVVVIGQPGTTTPGGEATGYQPFHVSVGHLRGFLPDLLGDQSLGRAKHDAWTYWGHSGSPLFDERGRVVAMHNSWDSHTAMRHAVPWEAISAFLARVR